MKTTVTKLYDSSIATIFFEFPDVEIAFAKGSQAQRDWDEFLMGEITPYVPWLTGIFAGSLIINTRVGDGELIWEGPQARRLYYNPQFKFTTAHHKKAGAFFDRRAMADRLEVWRKYLAQIISRELGGRQ